MNRHTWGVLVAIGTFGTGVWDGTACAGCKSDQFVIDTTGATQSVSALWGAAPGQTFVAEDTLVSTITVWRLAVQTPNIADMKLWITEVDDTGRPRNDQVVFEGPVIRVELGDGVHPIEIRYDLDPPAVLPHRGKFAFFIQDQCNWFFDLLVRGSVFPDGELWRSEIANSHGCVLWSIHDRFDAYDLCCRIEFCDVPTPVSRPSWGKVKAIYR